MKHVKNIMGNWRILFRDETTENPRGELVDFYDGGDHVRPFSQTPKYVD